MFKYGNFIEYKLLESVVNESIIYFTPNFRKNLLKLNNTNDVAKSLGWKTVATFKKLANGAESILASHGNTSGNKLLKDLPAPGEHIATTDLGTGTFRLYVGLETNPSDATQPTGSQVFSGGDKPGLYTGNLTISATVA